MIYIKTTIKKLIVFSRRVSYYLTDFILLKYYSLLNFNKKNNVNECDIVFVTATDSYYFDKVINLLETSLNTLKTKFIYTT